MGKYNFRQTYLWSEIQNQFLKFLFFFYVKPLFQFFVKLNFSLLQCANANISENIFQPDDPRSTQPLATHFDCSKQYSLRQFSLNWGQKFTQPPSEIEYPRIFASYLFEVRQKIKAFHCSETIPKTRVFCVQCG